MTDFSFSYSGLKNKVTTPPNRCEPNHKIGLRQLVDIIRSDPPQNFYQTRQIVADGVGAGRPWSDIKTAVKPYKDTLPWFLFSGHCQIHHNDDTLEYNGAVQIDLDFKHAGGNQRAAEVKEKLSRHPNVKLAAFSPSGYGVKGLIQTTNKDKNKHLEAAKLVIRELSAALQIETKYFDSLGASQPCFVPYDQDPYVNENADVFQIDDQMLVDQVADFERVAIQINEPDAIRFAERFAELKGYQYIDGQKHNYIFLVAVACNLLGVEIETVYAYAAAKGKKLRGSNCVSYPYRKYKDSFGVWGYRLKENQQANSRTIIRGEAGQKLADLVDPADIIGKQLIAPTGSGKTYLVARAPGRRVLLVPTVSLAKNIEKEYKAFRVGGAGHTGKNIYVQAPQHEFIVCTYASFKKLARYLLPDAISTNVFFDEAHNFSAATSRAFQLEPLSTALDAARDFKSITLMTGTEVFNAHPVLASLPVVEFRIPKQQKECFFVDAADTIYSAADAVRRSIDRGRFPILLFDNTGARLATLKAYARDLEGIKFFSSHTKDDDDWQTLVEDGRIRDGVRGIVTTSVLKEGNNIYDDLGFDIIVCGSYHSSAIEQLASRPRRAKSVTITIIRGIDRDTSDKKFNPVSFAGFLELKTLALCDELNTRDAGTDTEAFYLEFKARQAIQQNPIKVNEQAGQYEVDYLRLSNFVYQQQATAENRNDQLMIAALNRYGIRAVFDQPIPVEAEPAEADKAAALEIRQEMKEREKREYDAALDHLAGATFPDLVAADKVRKSDQLTKGQKKAYGWFAKLSEISANSAEIIEQLRRIEAKRSRFILLLKQLTVAQLEADPDYMKTNRLFVILIKAMRASFTDGEILRGEEIKARLKKVLALDKSINWEAFEQDGRNDKALRAVRNFFELEAIRVRTEVGRLKVYQVRTLNFDRILDIHSKVRVHQVPVERFDEVGQPVFNDPIPF